MSSMEFNCEELSERKALKLIKVLRAAEHYADVEITMVNVLPVLNQPEDFAVEVKSQADVRGEQLRKVDIAIYPREYLNKDSDKIYEDCCKFLSNWIVDPIS